MIKMQCPHDGTNMAQAKTPDIYECEACRGQFVLDRNLYQNVEQRFHFIHAFKPLSCPVCGRDMAPFHHDQGSLELDLCNHCQGVWFDASEQQKFRHFAQRWVKRTDQSLKISKHRKKPPKQKQEELSVYEYYKRHSSQSGETTGSGMLLQILFDLPIERNLPAFRTPLVTLCLIAINIIVVAMAYTKTGQAYFESWVFYAETPSLTTMISSTFAHANLLHLLGNMYFLYVAGDNVEDLMGRWKYFIFYMACGIVASASYTVAGMDGGSLGASGAIAGVMAAYIVFFPKAKLALRFFFIYEIEIPCWLLFGFYFAMDFFFLGSNDGIGHLAHLSGFVLGLVVAFIFKKVHLI